MNISNNVSGSILKAVLIDDEPLALLLLQAMLEKELGGVEIVGSYSNPEQAVDAVKQAKPHVVFLDIQMPGLSGLKVAELLQSELGYTEIVFVTGYNQYAVEAFELCALDYILKPFQMDRLKKTIERIYRRQEQSGSADASNSSVTAGSANTSEPPVASGPDSMPILCCARLISVQWPGEQPQWIKWRTSKAQELFALLLHHRGQAVTRDAIIELLWPDFEPSRAAQHLYTTAYTIRRTLKSIGLTMVTLDGCGPESGYRLCQNGVRTNTELWEEELGQFLAPDMDNIEAYQASIETDRFEYLEICDYIWAIPERERLRHLWLQHAHLVGRFLMENSRLEAASQIYCMIQQRDPDDELTYFTLMKIYDRLNRRQSVAEQYRQLQRMALEEWDGPIQSEIADWYERWCQLQGSLNTLNDTVVP